MSKTWRFLRIHIPILKRVCRVWQREAATHSIYCALLVMPTQFLWNRFWHLKPFCIFWHLTFGIFLRIRINVAKRFCTPLLLSLFCTECLKLWWTFSMALSGNSSWSLDLLKSLIWVEYWQAVFKIFIYSGLSISVLLCSSSRSQFSAPYLAIQPFLMELPGRFSPPPLPWYFSLSNSWRPQVWWPAL